MATHAKKATKASASSSFTAAERAAMREAAAERKAAAKGAEAEAAVLAKIAQMNDSDRIIAEGLHALVKKMNAGLTCKTWYGMPAYQRNEKTIFFFQDAGKFNTRYATLGFSDSAQLDDGAMWPAAFALTKWTPAVAKRVRELIERALG
ncbi:MAG: hypothetical protein EBU85_02385 [Actinobacteria bacterium]|nr:hypothetical protein [Actinomycetota bacterium]